MVEKQEMDMKLPLTILPGMTPEKVKSYDTSNSCPPPQKVGKLKLQAKRWLPFLYPNMCSKKQTAYKKERNRKS